MTSGPPAPIDRAALERIIRRATELQTQERELGEQLSPDEVLALGKEVGIPSRYLQQALFEERNRIAAPTPAGMWDRLAGPGALRAQRVVRGDLQSVGDALVAYLDDHELLCVQRRQPSRISFEQIRGFQAAIRRSSAAFGGGRKPFMLAKAETVTATLTPLEDGFVHVLLEADVRRYRTEYVAGGAASVTIGAAATAVLFALGAFAAVAVAPLPLALGLGYGIVRQYPPKLERLQLGLERTLDHLEQGDVKPQHRLPPRGGAPRGEPPFRPGGLIGTIMEEVRRNIGPR